LFQAAGQQFVVAVSAAANSVLLLPDAKPASPHGRGVSTQFAGNTVVAAYTDGSVWVRGPNDKKWTVLIKATENSPFITALAASTAPTGPSLVALGYKDQLDVWDIKTKTRVATLSLKGWGDVTSIVFDPSGTPLNKTQRPSYLNLTFGSTSGQ